MDLELQRIVKVDELADLVPREAGATWSALWQVFYYTRLLKYVHRRHYPEIKKSFNKICTDRKLLKLCELGYFKSPQKDIYCATNKVLPILHEAGYITDLLPPEPQGKGDINELNNTRVFISLMKQKYFYTFLYPNFGYLIPDALMVLLDKERRRYKLIFIEVERKKPDWEQWIDNKKSNFLRLANDYNIYLKWKEYCKFLNFPVPNISNFKFVFRIIT